MIQTKSQLTINGSQNKKKNFASWGLIALFILLVIVGQLAFGKFQTSRRVDKLKTGVGYSELQNKYSLPEPVRTTSCVESTTLGGGKTCYDVIDKMYYAANEAELQDLYAQIKRHLEGLGMSGSSFSSIFEPGYNGNEPDRVVAAETYNRLDDYTSWAEIFLYTPNTIENPSSQLLDLGIQDSAMAVAKSKSGYVLVLTFVSKK